MNCPPGQGAIAMDVHEDSGNGQADAVSAGRRFSEEWHRFAASEDIGWGVDAPDDNVLKAIETLLAGYESSWQTFTETNIPITYDEANVAPKDAVGVLRYATLNLDLVQRIVLCRSIHLYRTFIASVNREDICGLPLLLRGIMEQGAFGIYTAQRIRAGFEKYRAGKPDAVRVLHEDVFSAVHGAKMNVLAFKRAGENYVLEDYGPWDELDLAKDWDQGFGENTVPKEQKGLVVASISTMIDAVGSLPGDIFDDVAASVSEEPLVVGDPSIVRGLWEWLSQYCHPSSFSWSPFESEIKHGGQYVPSEVERVMAKQRILNPFVAVAGQVVCFLPGVAVSILGELKREVEQDAEVLESKP